jgi:hypothetical protein
MRKDLALTPPDNPQKLDPPFILFASTHDIDGKVMPQPDAHARS